MTVTNNEGNQAIYGDQLLSNGDIKLIDVSFYPNPINDILYFSLKSNTILSINIFNLLGKKVANYNNSEGIDQISLTNLDSGFYFLRILTDKGKTIKK